MLTVLPGSEDDILRLNKDMLTSIVFCCELPRAVKVERRPDLHLPVTRINKGLEIGLNTYYRAHAMKNQFKLKR